MTVGFHSPLPPARTGVADYASHLLAALRRRGSLDVDSRTAAINLYHLGNNQLHREIYRRSLARPGVSVLHDAVLHHFLLGWMERADYIEEFVFNYGEWARGQAEDLWAGRAQSGADSRYFDHPMLRRVGEVARAIVVHNPAAKRMVLRHASGARVCEIPHPFLPLPEFSASQVLGRRHELGIEPRTFVFSVLGYLRESKRLQVILRAFDEAMRQGLDAVLLIAGEFVSSDLERAVGAALKRPDVRWLGRRPESEFWLLAAASDACINLRYPAAGETSGIAVRMMGLGKPVIVTEGEEVLHIPAAACLRVEHGVAEKDELVQHMILLARTDGLARDIGRLAAAHIQERHSLETVADAYWKLLCDCRT